MVSSVMKYSKWLLILAMAVTTSACQARTYEGHEGAQALIDDMVKNHQFDRDELEALFAQVEYKDSIIKAITRPAEAKPWKDYRKILVTEKRMTQGVEFWQENEAALARAEAELGVPAEIIVAIIGVETRYGRIMGSYRVADALATLAFDYPRRSKFFTGQLKEFLLLTREEQFDPLSLKGSYAGAMGFGQFMPGSFRSYAIDFDGDERKDIWKNRNDAIGSVANYFKRHGWTKDAPVVVAAELNGGETAEAALASHWVKSRKQLKPTMTLAELQALGLIVPAGYASEQPATAIKFEIEDGHEYWVGLHNFYVITRYNHSTRYAMAVYQLSQQIKAAKLAAES